MSQNLNNSYTPPTSPFSVSRRRSFDMKESAAVDEDATDSEQEEPARNTSVRNLLNIIEYEKKFEAARKEIEAGSTLNVEQKKGLLAWENGLRHRESMLCQREKDIVRMLHIRENNLKHRENSVLLKGIMLSNKRVRLDYADNNREIIAKVKQCQQRQEGE